MAKVVAVVALQELAVSQEPADFSTVRHRLMYLDQLIRPLAAKRPELGLLHTRLGRAAASAAFAARDRSALTRLVDQLDALAK